MTEPAHAPTVVVVMGVAGSGKTTVGRRLATALGAAFEEGDDYHPPANVAKMRAAVPLTDADRAPWLERLAAGIDGWLAEGRRTVLACSALKESYREVLIGARADVALVYLRGPEALIGDRLAARIGHYMPVQLLASQLATLEEPRDAITADVAPAPEAIVDDILGRLRADSREPMQES